MTYPTFLTDISRMNQVYDLKPVDLSSYSAICKRLEQFETILGNEFEELNDIMDGQRAINSQEATQQRTRVELADLLADIIVYCASEAQRWNIPLAESLEIVMLSNFSKLGADGLPIKNPKTDKFEKGPNYWKPEPYLQLLISDNDNGISTQLVVDMAKTVKTIATALVQPQDPKQNPPE